MVRGATPSVMRAMRHVGPIVNTESQPCPVCHTHELDFYFDDLGRTIERCRNRRCVMHHPHKPVPDGLAVPGLTARERRLERLRARRRLHSREN